MSARILHNETGISSNISCLVIDLYCINDVFRLASGCHMDFFHYGSFKNLRDIDIGQNVLLEIRIVHVLMV